MIIWIKRHPVPLQATVAPASAPGHFFGALVTGDAQFSPANCAGVAVRVVAAAVRPGHGPSAVLDGVSPEAHQGRFPPRPEGRLGRRRRAAIPVVLRHLRRLLRRPGQLGACRCLGFRRGSGARHGFRIGRKPAGGKKSTHG